MHLLILTFAALAQYSVEPGYTVDPRFSVIAVPAPKPTQASPLVTAAVPNRGTNTGKPAAAPRHPDPDNNLLDVHGIVVPIPDLPEHGAPSGTVLDGKGEKVKLVQEQTKDEATLCKFCATGHCRFGEKCPYCGEIARDRKWVNDTAHPGWQAWGWVDKAGELVGVQCYRRTPTNDVSRPSAPAIKQFIKPGVYGDPFGSHTYAPDWPPSVIAELEAWKSKPPVMPHGAHFSIRNADGTPWRPKTPPPTSGTGTTPYDGVPRLEPGNGVVPVRAVAPQAQPPAPTLYIMTDATGKQWSSPDPAWLAEWVRRVNTPPATSYSPAAGQPMTCGPNGCPQMTPAYTVRRGFFRGIFGR